MDRTEIIKKELSALCVAERALLDSWSSIATNSSIETPAINDVLNQIDKARANLIEEHKRLMAERG